MSAIPFRLFLFNHHYYDPAMKGDQAWMTEYLHCFTVFFRTTGTPASMLPAVWADPLPDMLDEILSADNRFPGILFIYR